jgi:hypothetical protein
VIVWVAPLAACAQETGRTSVADTNAVTQAQVVTNDTAPASPSSQSIDVKMGYPFTVQWIPGQKDSGDFEMLSKYRAHEKRLAHNLLVLTLDTPTVSTQTQGKRVYLVADSTVVTDLSYGDFFRNDCKMGRLGDDGLITGIITTNPGAQHPRFAWQFDTVSLKIRPLPRDSVWCSNEEVD